MSGIQTQVFLGVLFVYLQV